MTRTSVYVHGGRGRETTHVGHLARSYIRRNRRSRIRRGVESEEEEEEYANKLALYLKQLLGIAVTHGARERIGGAPYCGPESVPDPRNRKPGGRGARDGERDGGGGEGENAPWKEIKGPGEYEAFRISNPGSLPPEEEEEERRGGGGRGPVSGQSEDKRVVRSGR